MQNVRVSQLCRSLKNLMLEIQNGGQQIRQTPILHRREIAIFQFLRWQLSAILDS